MVVEEVKQYHFDCLDGSCMVGISIGAEQNQRKREEGVSIGGVELLVAWSSPSRLTLALCKVTKAKQNVTALDPAKRE
jgi:hypothetical protein